MFSLARNKAAAIAAAFSMVDVTILVVVCCASAFRVADRLNHVLHIFWYFSSKLVDHNRDCEVQTHTKSTDALRLIPNSQLSGVLAAGFTNLK